MSINPTPNAYAHVIFNDWGEKVNYAAAPYLDGMSYLESFNHSFGCDSAQSVTAYFLANARSWKGDTARRVKLELNDILKNGTLSEKYYPSIVTTYWEKSNV